MGDNLTSSVGHKQHAINTFLWISSLKTTSIDKILGCFYAVFLGSGQGGRVNRKSV